MKIRVQSNYDRKTDEDIFGIGIMLDGGRTYCKYPLGHQSYKTYSEAENAKNEVLQILRNGGSISYGINGSTGINKSEYVKIENSKINRNEKK
ncbi:hypothetical protein [uncultured Bacteroides sp.]|uniref:hypothetical protein n=1 Tax=uncultured Bacteroides sp. TaxID=162156 RepID=UPI002AA86D51|nr:hypothetical protein [uncultured Bacteroides sp.]